jgi:seryl-tRNA synthetase
MNSGPLNDSDAVPREISMMREKRRLEEEVERLQAAAKDAAARVQERHEAAVGEVLDVLAESSRRANELEDALTRCTDAIAGLVGISLAGTPQQLAEWRERLDELWEARARALERLPRRQP